jgi:hypothetical protein
MLKLLLIIGLGVFCASCTRESAEDAAMKNLLVGSWYFEFKDPSERLIRTVVSLDPSGTYKGREAVTGEPREEHTSGPWYVTEGQLKMNAAERDGKKLGTLQMDYRTCKVEALTTEGFDCLVAGSKLRFKKVPNGFPLS